MDERESLIGCLPQLGTQPQTGLCPDRESNWQPNQQPSALCKDAHPTEPRRSGPSDGFCRNRKTHPKIPTESPRDTKCLKQPYIRRTELEDSHSLISKLSTKPQSPKECGWHRDRHGPQDGAERPQTNPLTDGPLGFDRGALSSPWLPPCTRKSGVQPVIGRWFETRAASLDSPSGPQHGVSVDACRPPGRRVWGVCQTRESHRRSAQLPFFQSELSPWSEVMSHGAPCSEGGTWGQPIS